MTDSFEENKKKLEAETAALIGVQRRNMMTPTDEILPDWKCAGCGTEYPNRVGKCDCLTAVVYRGQDTDFKISPCKNHKDRPMRENIDGDDLCLDCCDAWVKSEKERTKNDR